jgi:hypothetical protein
MLFVDPIVDQDETPRGADGTATDLVPTDLALPDDLRPVGRPRRCVVAMPVARHGLEFGAIGSDHVHLRRGIVVAQPAEQETRAIR